MTRTCKHCNQPFETRGRGHNRSYCYRAECEAERQKHQRKASAELNRNYRSGTRIRKKRMSPGVYHHKPKGAEVVIKKCLQCKRMYKTVYYPGDSRTRGRCPTCKHSDHWHLWAEDLNGSEIGI